MGKGTKAGTIAGTIAGKGATVQTAAIEVRAAPAVEGVEGVEGQARGGAERVNGRVNGKGERCLVGTAGPAMQPIGALFKLTS